MASRKKVVRKKSAVRTSYEPVPMAAPPAASPAGGGSNLVKFLIAAILIFLVYKAFNLFRGDSGKPFKVEHILTVSGDNNPSGFFNAWGIAPVAGQNWFVLCDQQNGRLLFFDFKGNFLRSVGKAAKKKGPMEFVEPSGMSSDSNGNIYVIDSWGAAIKGFDENGRQILDVDLDRVGGFYGPRGVAFDGRQFAVADTGSHRVVLVSKEGTLVKILGSSGKGPGKFESPSDIASDGKGNYFISDCGNKRLQWMDLDGNVKKLIKCYDNPNAVCVDKAGRVYLALGGNESCVKVYDPNGNYAGDLTDEKGSGDPFRGVRGIAVNSDNVLMISRGTTAALFKVPPAR